MNTLDELAVAIEDHVLATRAHADACSGEDALTSVSEPVDPTARVIGPTTPLNLGSQCTCGWRHTVRTTPIDVTALFLASHPSSDERTP